jgi:uncharacterized LabA/DUF88 family protein
MTIPNTLVFVDGENLTFRYKEMLAVGRIPRPDNVWIEDCFIWNQRVFNDHLWRIKRLSYYTSVIGDDVLVRNVREQIAATTFTCTTDRGMDGTSVHNGQVVPFVRKKSSRSRKESVCDIAIAVDVMRACYRDHADTVWIFSGDGDFVQLAQEVVHSGKTAYVSAFTSGLSSELRLVVDDFLPLDKYFFLTDDEISAAKQMAIEAAESKATAASPPVLAESDVNSG